MPQPHSLETDVLQRVAMQTCCAVVISALKLVVFVPTHHTLERFQKGTVFRHTGALLSHVGYMNSPCSRRPSSLSTTVACLRSFGLYISVDPSRVPRRIDTSLKGAMCLTCLTLSKRQIRARSAAVQPDFCPTFHR